MFRPHPFRLLFLAVIGLFAVPASGFAGWICIKNETKLAVVIQEVPDPPGLKRGKLVKLLPGETYREYQPAAGEKTVQVFDARTPTKPLCAVKLTWPAADVTFKVETAEQVVRLAPVKPEAAPVVAAAASQPKPSPAPPKR